MTGDQLSMFYWEDHSYLRDYYGFTKKWNKPVVRHQPVSRLENDICKQGARDQIIEQTD